MSAPQRFSKHTAQASGIDQPTTAPPLTSSFTLITGSDTADNLFAFFDRAESINAGAGNDTLSLGGATIGTNASIVIGADTTGFGASFTSSALISVAGTSYTQFTASNGQTLTILGNQTSVTVTSLSAEIISAFEA